MGRFLGKPVVLQAEIKQGLAAEGKVVGRGQIARDAERWGTPLPSVKVILTVIGSTASISRGP